MATYRRLLKDGDGNTIIPAMTGDQTEWIQTNDIADEAVTSDKIDFTTFGNQSSYFDIGDIRVAFGSYSQSYASGSEIKSPNISYGVSFSSAPKVIITPCIWAPITECMTSSTNTTFFNVVLKHIFGSTLTIPIHWIAIGAKA